jgi:hypothetical protein
MLLSSALLLLRTCITLTTALLVAQQFLLKVHTPQYDINSVKQICINDEIRNIKAPVLDAALMARSQMTFGKSLDGRN